MIKFLAVIVFILVAAQFTRAQQSAGKEISPSTSDTSSATTATNDFAIKYSAPDTIIDFNNEQIFENLGGYNNDVIKEQGKTLYVKITFHDSTQPQLEYFYINDSTYYCREYYQNGSIKSDGNYKVTHTIVGCDTISIVDTAGDEDRHLIRFRKIIKDGEWSEYNGNRCDYDWQGNYKNSKRVGAWKFAYVGMGAGYVLYMINYDVDSLKRIYGANMADSLTLNEFNTIHYTGQMGRGISF